jgi:hypothetical protein
VEERSVGIICMKNIILWSPTSMIRLKVNWWLKCISQNLKCKVRVTENGEWMFELANPWNWRKSLSVEKNLWNE